MHRLKHYAVVLALLLAGVSVTLAYAPYSLWWLPFFSFAVLAWFIKHSRNNKQAAGYGFAFGLGWFGSGISWVHVSIDQFGGLPLIGSLSLMALLVAYLSLYPALASWLTARLSHRSRLFPLIFPASWIVSEWLRSWLLTGFPWLSVGYTQTSAGLTDWAPLIGETGISFLLIFIAAAVAQLYSKTSFTHRYLPLLAGGILLALSPLLSAVKNWHYTDRSVSVLLVQGNIAQSLRWEQEQEWPTMLKYLDMTRPYLSSSDIVIWPESAIPQLEPAAQDYLKNFDRAAYYQDSAVISGIIDYNIQTQQAWNNLIVLGKRQPDDKDGSYDYQSNRYSKHHLLPIGEFVPFENWLRHLAPIFNLPMSSFSRGDYVQPNLQANGINLLPAICFEIAFPQQIAANMTSETDLLLTVSNDAWFGDSIGPHQHLQIAQMRALEFGKPVLRATNNGITATIDADGKILQQLPQFTADVLEDNIRLTTGSTIYSRIGNWPVHLFSLAILIIVILRTRLQARK